MYDNCPNVMNMKENQGWIFSGGSRWDFVLNRLKSADSISFEILSRFQPILVPLSLGTEDGFQ